MAFTKVSGLNKAITCDKASKKYPENRPVIIGFVVGTKQFNKEYKTRGGKKETRTTTMFNLVDPKTGSFNMWGNGSINYIMLDDKNKLKPEFKDKLVRFSFKGMLPKKPGQNAGREIEIEIDRDAKLPKGAGRVKF